jgi:hypothetical protein
MVAGGDEGLRCLAVLLSGFEPALGFMTCMTAGHEMAWAAAAVNSGAHPSFC